MTTGMLLVIAMRQVASLLRTERGRQGARAGSTNSWAIPIKPCAEQRPGGERASSFDGDMLYGTAVLVGQ